MEIDLGQEIVITVRLGAKTYKLREPTLNDVEAMTKVDDNDPMSANRALQDFIVKLGMPKEVVQNLGIMKLKDLANGLTGSFSEKK